MTTAERVAVLRSNIAAEIAAATAQRSITARLQHQQYAAQLQRQQPHDRTTARH